MQIDLSYKNNEPLALTDYLTSLYIPRKTKHFLRMNKSVLVNDTIVPFHTLLKDGDLITIYFDETLYNKPNIIKTNSQLDILFEDEHLIVVNKPIHLKTHPNEPTEANTLLNFLAAYLDKKGQIPYVVHRLDMETSGCILFAKNPIILPLLSRMLENKEIIRLYEAIVLGKINENQLTINKPIGQDKFDKRKRTVDYKSGKKAITHIKTIKRYDNETRIACHLDTGRTHQIRVHLASINHPLKGDPLYQKIPNKRLFLHAKTLTFIHPFTQKKIICTAKVPF